MAFFRLFFQKLCRFAHIPLYHKKKVFQIIYQTVSLRKISTFFLELDPRKHAALSTRRHKYWDHPVPRTHIKNMVLLPGPCKIRQQHRIHAKTKKRGVLYKDVPVPLQVIKPLPRVYI